ncbi:hypothetical protein Tco_0598512, partial [Tanacetum coccineum]
IQVTQKDDGIFISQDKYVDEILKKFGFSTVKTTSTPIETSKPLMKDENAEDVDVHLYRSMIGSLMYLTSSRPAIMFVDSPFDLEAYTDNDYVGASLDRKSTTGGYQFLGSRLISWQCKKQTIVANSTTEAEYVATTSCCGQKPEESDGFKGIIDFLNASSIKYALTVNPTIYTSCIKQLWATAKAKTVNGEVQIQALVDRKKVIVTETSVRRALQLKDAEGTECLPNATIFEQLTLMGYENLTQKLIFYKAFFSPQWKFIIHTILQCLSAKTTAWNEFSSTMASVVIYLATNQKFNFSKYIYDNMVKNLEGGVKFLMYLRFVQVFLDKQVEGITKHKEIYVTPSYTKKVFANMKREGKGFSRRVTPLFQTMMVQAPEELGERKYTKVPQPIGSIEPITDEAANEGHVPIHSNDPLLSGKDRLKLNELMELCTNLSQKILNLVNTKTSQAVEIAKLKERVKMLERSNKSRTLGLKRLRKVGRSAQVVSSEDEGLGAQEDASKQGRKIADLDADAEEVEVEKVVRTAEVTIVSATTTTVDELTLAQTLIEIKAAKPKAVTTAATTTTTTVTTPKARGVVVKVPNYELAQRLQVEEHEELTIEERSKLFVELMDKRKKHFVKLRAEDVRRKPPTKAQKRNQTYSFVPMDSKVIEGSKIQAEGSRKRTREELESDNSKKQKIDENVEAEVDDEA